MDRLGYPCAAVRFAHDCGLRGLMALLQNHRSDRPINQVPRVEYERYFLRSCGSDQDA